MSGEGISGQKPVSERWAFTEDGQQRVVHIDYDDHGCTTITREALSELMRRAGLTPEGEAAEGDSSATEAPQSAQDVAEAPESHHDRDEGWEAEK